MKKVVTFENISYGITVDVLSPNGHPWTSGKVHFFNKKGVLVGNVYEFLPYERILFRDPFPNGESRQYHRIFFRQKFAALKMFLFKPILILTSLLIRFTQKYLD